MSEGIERLEAENAALRESVRELMRWAQETDVKIGDADDYEDALERGKLLLAGASPVVVLTLEEARELATRRECPACGETVCGSNPWHSPDCFLAAKIRRAEEDAGA